MPIATVKEYCKTKNIPVTAVKCKPRYDENKGRVTKGETFCHTGWNKKQRYNDKHVTETPFADNDTPTAWMMHLESARFFIIDIDVKDGKKAIDVMKPEHFDKLYNDSEYVVETGSGGLHFYYKLPEDFKSSARDFTKIENDYFKEGEKGEVDIIMKAIITEGSNYSYESTNFNYTVIKGSIEDVSEFSNFTELYNGLITEESLPTISSNDNINQDEVIEHVNNIPNTERNWDNWYRMGQLIYNIVGSNGYEVWRDWSAKNPFHNEKETYKQWRTFKPITGGKPLTIKTLYFQSEKANPEAYYKIRSKYSNNDDFWNLIKLPTHYESAKFFYNYKPYAYIYKTEFGWYSLLKNNTWSYSKEKPGYLINDIAQTFKELCNIKKNEIDLNSDNDSEKNKLKQLIKFNSFTGTLSFCEAVGKFLQNFYLDEEILTKMDESLNLFAFTDKVYDLDKSELRDIQPTDYISITCGYSYPKQRYAKANAIIKKFLWDIFEDNELIEFEMNKMAYSLHGEKKLEKFVIETGDGRNGKGTKSKLIKSAFGNYFVSIPATVLTKPNERKDAPNPAVVTCRGCRYIEATEPEKDERFQVGFIKAVSGNDVITCRELFGKNVQFIVRALLSIQSNGVPKWSKPDEAIEKRTIIQPFPFMFIDDNEELTADHHRRGNPDLKKMLLTQECRDEYIQMLLEQYKEFKDKKCLYVPKAVKERTEQNKNENIVIKMWADENIEKTKNVVALDNKILWKKYQDDMGTSAVSSTNFPVQMALLGYNKKRTNSGVVWTNVVLKENKSNISI